MRKSWLAGLVRDFFRPEIQAWDGRQPLWKVFWIYGVVTSAALIVLYALGFYLDRVALRQFLLLGFALYTAWLLVAIWRCADNTQERIWSLLARLLAVAWASNAALVFAFLQLNLIARYYLHHQ